MGRGVFLAAVAALVPLTACTMTTSAPSIMPASSPTPGLPVIVPGPDDPSLPYGITAIDYHFHDAHPSIPLEPTRTVRWTNIGRVRHNVTFPDVGFSKDLSIGGTFEIDELGRKLGGPGTYSFFCKYHDTLGMSGVIVIADPGSAPSG